MLKPGNYEVLVYQGSSGGSPYLEWLEELDEKTQDRILARARRMARGQFGDCKAVGAGLYELRLFFGPGYRVYFAEHQGRIILILNGAINQRNGRTSKGQRNIGRAIWRTTHEKGKKKQGHPSG